MRWWIAAVLALLAACAGFPQGGFDIPAGTPRDAVIARAGAPTRVVPLPAGGERLQYSLQPVGQEAWMVDLDASGKVVRSFQALTFENFIRILPGWAMADVEREFGPPAKFDSVMSWRGPIWTYRWRDVANADMFYYVYFDDSGIVGRAHQGMELRNLRMPIR
ncbi:MAG TPA: hypothetical protein VIE63_04175 [Ramlibacter sp.]